MDIRAVKFRVEHGWRVGGLYRPAAAGRFPAVLMLHGFPGVQRNEDLAAELCRRGFAVFAPHGRGCWGSGGEFSVHGLLEDARADLRLLERYRFVDPSRVALLGYSLGGWTALRLASERRAAAVAVMAPALPGWEGGGDASYIRRNAKVVNLPRPGEVWTEYLAAKREDHPELYLPRISPAPLLVVQGLADAMVPPDCARSVYALAKEPKELLELPGEDHEFQGHRHLAVAAVASWLADRLL
jgi:dipeptidyl aminopeptidase/acylaminoacyl peptidase